MATAGTYFNFKRTTKDTPRTKKSEHCPKCGASCYINPNGKLIVDWNCSDCKFCGTK